MNESLPVTIILGHMRARREALTEEINELRQKIDRLEGAIQETRVIETQIKAGIIPSPRLSCE
jgi:hypothetical protein